ncbi:hypothetical protein H1C71_001607 [Ictidomys tridecemlineatus]|nr:hypothetical protein H1C71_001607 [Ictidomys tridecemlineatus]
MSSMFNSTPVFSHFLFPPLFQSLSSSSPPSLLFSWDPAYPTFCPDFAPASTYGKEHIQHLSFWLSLISLSMLSSSSTHFHANDMLSFFMTEQNPIVYVYLNFFILFSLDGILGWPWIWGTVV